MRPIPALLLIALLPVAAADAVYRCAAVDGSTRYQDQPCHRSPANREARTGEDGVRVEVDAPPPAEDGAVAADRYRRYLDQVADDQRARAEADTARAARLRAEAALAAAEPAPAEADRCAADPAACDRGWSGERWLPVFLPGVRPPRRRPPINVPLAPPPVAPAPGPRPNRPPPREPRDVRSEILDTRR